MIIKYIDFINELRIMSKVSGSGSTREIDTILDEPIDNKSLSAAVLLKKRLKEEEFQSDLAKIIDPDSSYAPSIDSNKFRKWIGCRQKDDRLIISINNLNFLKNEMKRLGILKCEYCRKGPLVIYDPFTKKVNTSYSNKFQNINKEMFNKSDGATCDHKQPISKGGSKFDITNLAVCCHRCNQSKSDMSYDEWLSKLKGKKINESSESIANAMNNRLKTRFLDAKNTISDLFLEMSDKYSIIEVTSDKWLKTYGEEPGHLLNHFSLSDFGDTHSGDTQFSFNVYVGFNVDTFEDNEWPANHLSKEESFKNSFDNFRLNFINKFKFDFDLFKSRLKKFGYLIYEWSDGTPYSVGYVYSLVISKNLKK